jgi:ribose transport system permease protein
MKSLMKKVSGTLVIPLSLFVILKILSLTAGDGKFAVGSDLSTIVYTGVYTCMLALAMAINLTSGRFDFSIGSVLVVSAIIGGNFAKNQAFGPLGLILSIVAVGILLGFVSGLVYVILRLPPMITSLGMTMVFESFSMLVNQSKGIRMIGKFNVLVFARQPYLWILLLVVLGVCTYFLYLTRFGYNYRALANGQKIALDTGINEKVNAVICYMLSGALVAVAAAIFLSKYGTISPESGLASSSYFMGAFLPIFIGGFISRYSNLVIGVTVGSFTQAMLSSGLVSLGLSNSLQTLINGVFVMAFLIFTTNSYKLQLQKMYRSKLAAAQAGQ